MLPRLLFAALLPLALSAADKWNVAYFFDVDDSRLALRDIAFPTDQRGIAIGMWNDEGRPRPVALITSNGGANWEMVRLNEPPLSLACSPEAVCWYSTEKAIYRSEEGGRDWKRVSKTKGILAMRFLTADEGIAAGLRRTAYSTRDGGKTWTPIPAAAELTSNPNHAAFLVTAARGPIRIIGGNSRPPRKEDLDFPDWMVPDEAAKRREWPATLLLLESRDSGANWKANVSSLFGTLTGLEIQPDGLGAAALLEFRNTFEYPSEILAIDFRSGRSRAAFRDKSMRITGLAFGAAGSAVAAGVEATGLRTLPIPRRVRFFSGLFPGDGAAWVEQDVDYRAVANRVAVTVSPGGRYWAATDQGMILRLDSGN